MIGGAWITEARERAEMTREDLALKSGYSVEQIEEWEYNRVAPTYDVIRALTRFCGWRFEGRLEPVETEDAHQIQIDLGPIAYTLSLTPAERWEHFTRVAKETLRSNEAAKESLLRAAPDSGR